jgi:hypothetical protein
MKVPITWEDAQNLPVPADDELELVAGLTMQEVYRVYRDKGGRALVDGSCYYFARQTGFRIPQEKFPDFLEFCKAKWKLIIQYLETEYRLR